MAREAGGAPVEKKKSWVSATLSWSVNPMLACPLTSRSRQLTRKCFLVPLARGERKRGEGDRARQRERGRYPGAIGAASDVAHDGGRRATTDVCRLLQPFLAAGVR